MELENGAWFLRIRKLRNRLSSWSFFGVMEASNRSNKNKWFSPTQASERKAWQESEFDSSFLRLLFPITCFFKGKSFGYCIVSNNRVVNFLCRVEKVSLFDVKYLRPRSFVLIIWSRECFACTYVTRSFKSHCIWLWISMIVFMMFLIRGKFNLSL